MTDLAAISAAVKRAAGDLPADALPELVAVLEAGKAAAYLRMVRPQPVAPGVALVDAADLARRLDLPETWVRDAARRKAIPVVYAGVHLRFDVDAVIAAMKDGKAALADRSKLSERGRKARDHRIVSTARRKKSTSGADFQAAATTLLPAEQPKMGNE